MKFGNN